MKLNVIYIKLAQKVKKTLKTTIFDFL